jgi:hypothetical protein
VGTDLEFVIPPGEGDVAVTRLSPEPSKVASRGALHASFSNLFRYPFDSGVVEQYRDSVVPPPEPELRAAFPTRRVVGFGLLGAGAVGVGLGTYFTVAAHASPSPTASQREVAAQNDRNQTARDVSLVGFLAGGVAAAAGAAVLLWPTSTVRVDASAMPGGAFGGLHGHF